MKSIQKNKEPDGIRSRASYVLFRELYDFLNDKPCVADILRKLYDILDAKKCFGSR